MLHIFLQRRTSTVTVLCTVYLSAEVFIWVTAEIIAHSGNRINLPEEDGLR